MIEALLQVKKKGKAKVEKEAEPVPVRITRATAQRRGEPSQAQPTDSTPAEIIPGIPHPVMFRSPTHELCGRLY